MGHLKRPRLAAMAVLLVGCGAPAPVDTSEADLAALDEIRGREIAGFAAGDMDALRQVFAADAVVLPPNAPGIQGHDAMAEFVAGMLAQVTLQASYTGHETTLAGDWAFEHYTVQISTTPKAGGATVQETGKGIHVYRRQADGGWQIVLDAWNTDTPPPPPPPAARRRG